MKAPAFAKQRPLVACAVCYGAGVFAGGMWWGFAWLIPGAGLVFALAAVALVYRKAAAVAAAFFFLGVLLAGLAANPALPKAGKYQIQGRVTGEAVRRESDGRITVKLTDVTAENEQGARHIKAAHWTYYPGKDAILPMDGQTVSFSGNLYHPSPQRNPFGSDFKAFLLQKGITVGISGARELSFSPQEQILPESPWMRARLYLSKQFDRFLGDDSGLAKALIIGMREDISEETRISFRDAGVAHVLAVSGLHVSLLVGILCAALRKLRLSPRALFVLFLVLLLAYCRLLDFSASIVRASIITLIYLLGQALHRRVDPLTSLAAAFLAILLFWPLELFNLGFQLSFLAVAGIITLGDSLMALYARWEKRRHPHQYITNIVAAYITTLSASAFTLLPLACAFHAFSLAGLLISPIAIAGVGLLMVLYLAGLLISLISLPLAQFVAWPIVKLTQLYESMVAWTAELPCAVLRLPSPAWWQALMVMALLILLTRYVLLKPRWRMACAWVMVVLLAGIPLLPRHDPVRYMQLDAGTADSAVILDGEKTLVIDTGEHGRDLASFVLSTGRRIDLLLLTHLHADHMAGLEQLLKEEVPIGKILMASGALEAEVSASSLQWLDVARERGIAVGFLGAGDEISLNRVRGKVLWPYHGAAYPGLDANANSLVMLWDLDGVSLLSTGDVGAAYSHYLTASAQVLKVPHHGSRHDATEALIAMVNPEIAIITASGTQPDRYYQAASRILNAGACYAVTGETGAVTITCQDGLAEVTGHLKGGLIHGL
ncbi:MAG: ComEC/Rec2 family competence protein [Christensenellales bacterium]|jgi:competence protein ComEC